MCKCDRAYPGISRLFQMVTSKTIMVIGQQTQSKGTLDNEEDKYDDKTKLLNADDGNFINTDT